MRGALLGFSQLPFTRRVGGAFLLALVVVLLLMWLHLEQRQTLQAASKQLGGIRQARIDLAKGFLNLQLAEQGERPYSRRNGVALLQQGSVSLEKSLDMLVSNSTTDLSQVRQKTDTFLKLLEDWRIHPAGRQQRNVALRIAFSELDHQADKLDEMARQKFDAINRRSSQSFLLALFGSSLALTSIVAIVLFEVHRQQVAQKQQVVAELAHQASEKLFQRLFQDVPVPLVYVHSDGRFGNRNNRFVQVFGYTEKEVPNIDSWWEHAYPDPVYRSWVVETWNTEVARATATNTDVRPLEYQVTCKDGSQRVMQISGIVIGEDFLATFFDVTARKQAELAQAIALEEQKKARLATLNQMEDANASRKHAEQALQALQESETRLRSIFEHSPVAIGVGELSDGRLVKVNTAWLQLLGFDEQEVVGRTTMELGIYRDEVQRNRIVEQMLHQGRISTLDVVLHRKDGKEITVLYSAEVISLDSRPHLLVHMTDVTERVAAEERLKIWSDAFEHADFGLAISEIEGNRFTVVNPAFARQRGYLPEEMVGLPVLSVFTPDRQEEMAGVVRTLDQTDHGVFESEHIRRDGSKFPVLLDITVVRDSGGTPRNRVAYALDITDRKKAEENIRQLNATLEQRVEQRTAELQAANRELDAFAYAVSHDLRAPLRAMSGFSQALVEDYGEQLSGEALIYLQEIRQASQHMAELIEALLLLSRTTRAALQRVQLDLSALATRICDELTMLEPERVVHCRVEPNLQVWADSRMLEVVMQNLLSNAWKYTGKTQQPEVRVYSEQRDAQLWFCVADNGAGFAMQLVDKLFQPFQRLHRQEEFPGIGIGLTTVQRIVHRHGGWIEACSEPGKGAVFCFCLPEAGEEEAI